jgi:hypothetical protein
MRKPKTLIVATALMAVVGAAPARADTKFGVRGGYYTDIGEPFVGAEVLTRVAHRLYFNPNFEYVFVEDATYFTLNGDVHYDFPVGGNVYLWAGAGLGWSHFDAERPDADNDAVVNLLAGTGVNAGGVIPYVQFKLMIQDDTEFAIAVGLRF